MILFTAFLISCVIQIIFQSIVSLSRRNELDERLVLDHDEQISPAGMDISKTLFISMYDRYCSKNHALFKHILTSFHIEIHT